MASAEEEVGRRDKTALVTAGGDLVAGQLEVESVDVHGDAGFGGLGNDRASVLESLPQHHLGWALVVAAESPVTTGSSSVLPWLPSR